MAFPGRPKQTASIIGDRNKLTRVIEAHLSRYYRNRRQERVIIRLQSQLRKLVSHKAWAVYLDLEDAIIQRDNRVRENLVRWILRARVRLPR